MKDNSRNKNEKGGKLLLGGDAATLDSEKTADFPRS